MAVQVCIRVDGGTTMATTWSGIKTDTPSRANGTWTHLTAAWLHTPCACMLVDDVRDDCELVSGVAAQSYSECLMVLITARSHNHKQHCRIISNDPLQRLIAFWQASILALTGCIVHAKNFTSWAFRCWILVHPAVCYLNDHDCQPADSLCWV
jgi:hypothetical protein